MITDFDLLDRVLGEIRRTCPMAVLHREPDVAAHLLRTDVDIGVAADPPVVMRAIVPRLEKKGVFVILAFHYDRGSYSFFFSNRNGTGGAQVDLVRDRRGVGRYGIKTDALLAARRDGVRWPSCSALDEALYVLRKRQVKGDPAVPALVHEVLEEFGAPRSIARCRELFSPSAASALGAAFSGIGAKAHERRAEWWSRVMRPSRLTRRCGYWAHIDKCKIGVGEGDLASRMSRLLAVTASADPSLWMLLSNLWRPRLVLSFGKLKGWPRPDLVLGAPSNGSYDAASELVAAMHRKVTRQFRLAPREVPT